MIKNIVTSQIHPEDDPLAEMQQQYVDYIRNMQEGEKKTVICMLNGLPFCKQTEGSYVPRTFRDIAKAMNITEKEVIEIYEQVMSDIDHNLNKY